jgi:hypothetical protein
MNTSGMRKESAFIVVIMTLLGTALFAIGRTAPRRTDFAQDDAHLIGNWTGESICQVKNSPCHDEKVVYHIAKGSNPGHVLVSADKIVDDKAINMGTGDYTYDRSNGTLLNETEGRVWKFTLNGKTMEGTLTMSDKKVYRRVTLKKEE